MEPYIAHNMELNINEGVRSKGPFLCLGLLARIKRAYPILINFSLLWLVKYYLNNSSNYLNIIFQSYLVFIRNLSSKEL